jgi:5-methylcytosine-specific restriction protein A
VKLAIRDPVEIADRQMSAGRRARIIERDHGACVRPACETPTDRLQVDHIVPLALGGADKDWNCETLCHSHHLLKTKADIAAIAKAKRREAAHTGKRPPTKRPIRSRPFPKSRPEIA